MKGEGGEVKEEKRISWMYYKFEEDGKVIRKIPYKLVYTQGTGVKGTKITVFDTKLFKLKGPRIFKGSDPIDPWSFFSVIELQGHEEGWFDPRKVRTFVEPTSKDDVLEKYLQYNDWFGK